MSEESFSHEGFCPICDRPAVFQSDSSWFRDHLLCSGCRSIPRERALMSVIRDVFPNFHELQVHESCPGHRGVSALLRRDCPGYSFSHYFPEVEPGAIDPQTHWRCENLERLTYADETFDLFITQDVLEHVFQPDAVFREIARVLKPGGAHIFTAPLVNGFRPSERRASLLASGDIRHHREPVYHGNPVNPQGSLVTMDWGYDIAARIQQTTGLASLVVRIDDIDRGIRAELIEVVVSSKPPRAPPS